MSYVDSTCNDAKICQLYQQGYSCKDIATTLCLPLLTVRTQLRQSGFDTRSYRKASDYNKQKVLLLISGGYSYSRISELLHVSTHLVREIVENNGMIGSITRFPSPIRPAGLADEFTQAKLREAYFSGMYGLAKCAETLQVSDKDFLWFVYHLSEKEIRVHHKLLIRKIKQLLQTNMSYLAIAKTLGISPSVVKRTI